jgi:hypothetical protein
LKELQNKYPCGKTKNYGSVLKELQNKYPCGKTKNYGSFLKELHNYRLKALSAIRSTTNKGRQGFC